MLDVVSILLAAAIGFFLVQVLDPVGSMQPRWAVNVFRAALGIGVGIGLTSVVFFCLDVAGVATPAVIFGVDVVFLASLTGLWLRARRNTQMPPDSQETMPGFRWTWLLALVFGIVLLASGIRVVQVAAALPVGDWDAWAIWNLRAKFLAGPAGAWRYAVSPLLSNTHPDYPLLLSGFIARSWKAAGNMDALVPVITALLFPLALLTLLMSVVALLRGTAAALLAGLVILSTTSLLTWAPAQYADIPLAFYYLSALALIFLAASPQSGRRTLLLAGLCASFAAWTKNEGIVFLVTTVIVFLIFHLWQRPRGPALFRFACLLGGVVPGLALTVWFKFFLAPVIDPLVKQSTSGLARLHDLSRYAQVAGGFFDNLLTLGSGATHPLILLAILAILVRWKTEDRYRLPALISSTTLALVFLSYCGVLVMTPYVLSWQVQTSFDRLILQLWPSALLIFFVRLRSVADIAPPVATKEPFTRASRGKAASVVKKVR